MIAWKMSKIGKNPVKIPAGVEVSLAWDVMTVKWPKGTLQHTIVAGVLAKVVEDEIVLSIDNEANKNLRWLTRTLVANMVEWVTNGYQKKLLIIGVWYGAQAQAKNITLSLWFSHKIQFPLPEGIQATTEQDQKGNTIITITGIDKQLLGETTAKIRSLREPEPYKGKGIRYIDEEIKLKPGKAAGK